MIKLLAEHGGIKETYEALDLNLLQNHQLKIFGDVFESLLGAVFMDSGCLVTTERVLMGLLLPYIEVYTDLDTMQHNPRTLLFEEWNSKKYMRDLKCTH